METVLGSAAAAAAKQLVTIHFNDGRIQDALLHSSLENRHTIQFHPQIPVDDRRKSPRAPHFFDVRIDQLGAHRATDISYGGAYVECLTPHPPEAIIPIYMHIGEESFCIEARVAFVDPGIGMGLQFYRVPTSVRARLEAQIHHIINTAGRDAMTTRRLGNERRADKSATKHLRIRRRTPDRRRAAALAAEPVEAEFSTIRSIFFRGRFLPAQPAGPRVFIEFHNGDELQATLFDSAREPQGFFAEHRVSAEIAYTVYVVRSAVKLIRYLV
jgi:hypothetical protein